MSLDKNIACKKSVSITFIGYCKLSVAYATNPLLILILIPMLHDMLCHLQTLSADRPSMLEIKSLNSFLNHLPPLFQQPLYHTYEPSQSHHHPHHQNSTHLNPPLPARKRQHPASRFRSIPT